jgi:subtilase family serine protease
MGGFSLRGRAVAGAVAGAAALAITASAAPASAAPPSPSPSRHTIGSSKPQWLPRAKRLGATPGTNRIDFGLLLGLRNGDDAVATLQRISDPADPDYGKALTPEQFRSRYAPNPSDVAAARTWLRSQGFQVEKTLPSGSYIEVSGTAAQINKAFGTTVTNYSYQGRTVHANAETLTLPADTPAPVVSAVSGVVGIDQGAQPFKPADQEPGPGPGVRTAEPCSDYFGQKTAKDQPAFNGQKQPYVVCGYTPQQLQSAYGETSLLRSGFDGRGTTVAVVDAYASPTMPADAQKYNQLNHQPAFRPGQYRQITPGPDGYGLLDVCDPQGWYVEQSLDIEAVHAMAPGADVRYVGGTDCGTGLSNAWAETIDSHRADIVTNSWSFGTDDITLLGADFEKFFEQFTLEAALTGITVTFGSGDSGDHTAGTNPAAKTAEFPSDLPFVTGVGGTTIGIDRDGRRQFEYGWQTAYASPDGKGGWGQPVYAAGGGGGPSAIFPQPFYQKGKVSKADATVGGKAMRTVPDISATGDSNSGMLVGATQVLPEGTKFNQFRIGGTSLSSPLIAGMLAVASQKEHRRLGFVNPALYRLLNTSALYDVSAPKKPATQVRDDYVNQVDPSDGTTFKLETIDSQITTLHDHPGYDPETGVGTPNGPQFFSALH